MANAHNDHVWRIDTANIIEDPTERVTNFTVVAKHIRIHFPVDADAVQILNGDGDVVLEGVGLKSDDWMRIDRPLRFHNGVRVPVLTPGVVVYLYEALEA